MLCMQHSVLGNKWAIISQQLPGRTPDAIKNRFKALSQDAQTLIKGSTFKSITHVHPCAARMKGIGGSDWSKQATPPALLPDLQYGDINFERMEGATDNAEIEHLLDQLYKSENELPQEPECGDWLNALLQEQEQNQPSDTDLDWLVDAFQA